MLKDADLAPRGEQPWFFLNLLDSYLPGSRVTTGVISAFEENRSHFAT
jgi:hypothetical protein